MVADRVSPISSRSVKWFMKKTGSLLAINELLGIISLTKRYEKVNLKIVVSACDTFLSGFFFSGTIIYRTAQAAYRTERKNSPINSVTFV
jgi:hypothetical protein